MAEDIVSPFAPPKADLEGGAVVATNQTLASRGTRFVAVLLDGLLSLPAAIPLWIGMYMNASATQSGGTAPGSASILMGLGSLVLLVFFVFQIYLLATKGQTIGKKWMKIRIVKLDGSNPGFVGAVLMRAFVNGLLGIVPFYGLVDILFIFNDDRRCLHDKIAGTRVVLA